MPHARNQFVRPLVGSLGSGSTQVWDSGPFGGRADDLSEIA